MIHQIIFIVCLIAIGTNVYIKAVRNRKVLEDKRSVRPFRRKLIKIEKGYGPNSIPYIHELPFIDMSNVTLVPDQWSRCELLTEFPTIDTSIVNSFTDGFANCELSKDITN